MEVVRGIAVEPSPVVSVIIPAYIAAAYICHTLDSVLAQSFTNYEILLVNDGSPDTEELEVVLKPYRDRIVYIKQENRGQAGARNTGLEHARGEFVCFLDNDDQWEPEYLSFHTAVMQADEGLAVHYCDAVIFGDTPRSGRKSMEFTPSNGPATFHNLVSKACTVLNCAAMSRRDAVLRAGTFNELLRYGEDIDLWLRIARQGGRIGYRYEALARCRLRSDSVSADVARMTEGYLTVLNSIRNSEDVSRADADFLDRQIMIETAQLNLLQGKEAMLLGNAKKALHHLEMANAYFHRLKIAISILLLRVAPKIFLSSYRRFAD
ncbi:MAG: glycosyltransferase family A protein [Bryobacteraceae bacterium]|jgi:glycosyltransferase involved in cell wall biosynthesis